MLTLSLTLATIVVGVQLQAGGERTDLLAIFDSEAPDYPPPGRLKQFSGQWRHFRTLDAAEQRHILERPLLKPFKRLSRHIHEFLNLDAAAKPQYLVDRIRKPFVRRRQAKTQEISPFTAHEREFVDLLTEIEDWHRHAWHAYHPPQNDYTGSLLLFRARNRPAFYFDTQTVGWENYVQGPLDVHCVPGTHNSILEDPEVQEVARHLQAYLQHSASQS